LPDEFEAVSVYVVVEPGQRVPLPEEDTYPPGLMLVEEAPETSQLSEAHEPVEILDGLAVKKLM
jgi:hypothetical protein